MRQQLSTKKSSMATFIFVASCLLIVFVACNNPDQTGTSTTTTTANPSPQAAAPLGIKNFPYLKVTKEALYDAFYRNPSHPAFKKLMVSFKINDYTNVPKSLSLVAHGTKQGDEPIEGLILPINIITQPADEVGNSPLDTEDLLYSTLEFHDTKIRRLVESAPNVWKDFSYLIFIPYVETKNGQRYLSYHVQIRPIPGGGAGSQENLNPCPPFKPDNTDPTGN
jgi:hypothetical protein